MQAKHICVFTTTESRAKNWPVNIFKPNIGLARLLPPIDGESVVACSLFIYAPIGCVGFVFGPCFVTCFWWGCFTLSVLWVCGLMSVAFPSHAHLI